MITIEAQITKFSFLEQRLDIGSEFEDELIRSTLSNSPRKLLGVDVSPNELFEHAMHVYSGAGRLTDEALFVVGYHFFQGLDKVFRNIIVYQQPKDLPLQIHNYFAYHQDLKDLGFFENKYLLNHPHLEQHENRFDSLSHFL